ncbi:hypothetical protein [Nostoc favosum]|uniref:Uncharacterized protein n=1 Tax=Nostoc favosum CHAB5714 TaxID=2780399 RepID=A0ABS8IC12_9NOSO|nr:hypothetical protein [Nostoc favosum]MCC5601652.1 hypothetical protein [Nostoc favosum CHAB5714]
MRGISIKISPETLPSAFSAPLWLIKIFNRRGTEGTENKKAIACYHCEIPSSPPQNQKP